MLEQTAHEVADQVGTQRPTRPEVAERPGHVRDTGEHRAQVADAAMTDPVRLTRTSYGPYGWAQVIAPTAPTYAATATEQPVLLTYLLRFAERIDRRVGRLMRRNQCEFPSRDWADRQPTGAKPVADRETIDIAHPS